jgi:hypothetical protein
MRTWGRALIIAAVAASPAFLGGCLTNNASPRTETAKTRTGLNSESPTTNINDLGNLNVGVALTLGRVIRTASNPSQQLDLIGDGTGAMGRFCVAQQGGNQLGASTCTCSYSYIRPDGRAESFEAPTIYREENLIRCSYIGIPPDVPFIKVKVHLTNSDTFSNEITFRFTGTGVALNLADSASFVHVRRYQCRDAIVIPYLFDTASRMYDPIRSEDPTLSYPMNYYSTNFGGSFAAYVDNPNSRPVAGAGGAVSGWNCPSVPNDSASGLDLTLFSVQSDGSSKMIYPPTGSATDRSTFFLARSQSGIFNMAVNAYTAPYLNTAEDQNPATPPPLGYGVQPIPAGPDQETCPDSSVTIPVGFKWVKVWQFRASLDDRKFKSSAKLASLGAIFCNPGRWKNPDAASNQPPAIVLDCGPETGGVIADSNGSRLADRVVTAGACFKLGQIGTGVTTTPADPCSDNPISAGVGCTTWGANAAIACRGLQKGSSTGSCPWGGDDYTGYAPGTDVYSRRRGDPNLGCPNDGFSAFCPDDSSNMYVAKDTEPGLSSLDGGFARYDFVFTVSPPTIMTKDFKNGTPASLPYTPYRFYAPGMCNSPDPDNPLTSGDCASSKIIRYGFKFHDVGTNGDAPSNDPGRLPRFPVCALQPI